MSMDYNSSYGYSSQGAARTAGGASAAGRAHAYPGAQTAGGMSQQQQAQGIPRVASGGGSGAGGAGLDRTAQINDYVAKQKAAKQNAPLIRKENQRLAEARAMSASRSKSSSSGAGYDDDDSHYQQLGGHGYDEPPLPAQQARANAAASAARPSSSIRPPATTSGYAPAQADRRQSSGQPARSAVHSSAGAAAAPKSVSYDDGYGSAPSTSGGSGGSGGGGSSNSELVKRVLMLEDQIRLLKQQNRIFLSFMQNTEQQLAELRTTQSSHAAPAAVDHPPQRSSSRSRNGHGDTSAASSYPNNMSSGTKQVLQRTQADRHAQPATGPASSRIPAGQQQAAQQSPSLGALGGRSDIDQSFAPLDSEDDAARRERLRSAKKKKELLNLRSKMKAGALPAQGHAHEQDDSRGRGYHADAYGDEQQAGYGYAGGNGGGGYGAPPQQQQPARSAHQRAPSGAASQQQQQQYGAPPQQAPRRNAPPPSENPEDDYGGGGGGGGFGGGGGDEMFAGGVPPGADEVVETFPCPNCERRFNAQALQKHVAKQICKQKPRKVFDMAAQRLEELAKEAREAGIALLPKKGAAAAAAAAKKADALPVKKQSKWRADHEKFMAAIQAGKQLQAAIASGVPLSSLPPPVTREEDDDRKPCPHCGRKFESGVADRHIPHCKNTKNKPKATAASAARLGSTRR